MNPTDPGNQQPLAELHLILGGARSGKSRYAMTEANSCGKQRNFLATASGNDTEMQSRIAKHQAERGSEWRLIEEEISLASALRNNARTERVIVVDCLTLWLSNCLLKNCWEREREALLAAMPELPGQILFVSNETGSGIVPLGELTRRFVDESGWLHQELARICQKVTLVVAGIPVAVKAP